MQTFKNDNCVIRAIKVTEALSEILNGILGNHLIPTLE